MLRHRSSVFFFLLIRRPPRSTLFPYHDALPIYAATRAGPPERPGLRSIPPPRPRATQVTPSLQKVSRSKARKNRAGTRSEEHTSELQSRRDLVCRLLLEKKKKQSH